VVLAEKMPFDAMTIMENMTAKQVARRSQNVIFFLQKSGSGMPKFPE